METTMAPKQVAECLLTLVMINLLVVSSFSLPLNRRALKLIQEINRKGPYIGLITVYPPEEAAFFHTRAFKPNPKHPSLDFSGRRFRVGEIHDKKVVYVRCGVGMVNAAAATQQMLDLFDVVGIVHFGISGNANNSMSIGDVTIPQQLAHTGIWDWVNPNRTLDLDDVAQLDFEVYNEPKGGENLLGHIGFRNEQFYSESGNPNIARPLFWAKTTRKWLQVAAHLEGIELVQCVNSSLCLPQKPKLVVGLRGSTGNTFVNNAAYRNFLFQTFRVSSVDMESSAVVMTSLSNGFPVIVIRGLSDLAGRQAGENSIQTFGPLAARNACKVVVQFIKDLPEDLDPSRRPGAGHDGYAALKMHPFFKGVDWKNLRAQTPPKLALEPGSGEADDVRDSSWNPSHIGDGTARQNEGNTGSASSFEAFGHVIRLASIDSFDSKWQQSLDPGESVLMISMVKKLQKLTSKKVQLILTNKPKLIYVDPAKLLMKGNIIWSDNSNDLNVQVAGPSQFKIVTPKKVLSFEDAKQRAWKWKKAIEGLQNR